MMRIGDVAAALDMSVDTLRYYEKIKLVPRVRRGRAGVRLYTEKDLSRLRFIQRARKMGFTLEEIGRLLSFRENPQQAKPRVRGLAHRKLEQIEQHLAELTTLRDELRLLSNLCSDDPDHCPILDKFDQR